MRIEQLSIFEHDARRVLNDLYLSKTTVILSDDGSPAAFLIDPATYQAVHTKLQLFEAIAQGERSLSQEHTLTHAQVKERLAKWLK